jgi:hypothetical protein
MASTSSPHDEELADLSRFRKGEHWTADNVRTILQWIHVSAINLDILQEATIHYKKVLRRNTVLSLILSTLASTTSLSQYSLNDETNGILVGILKGAFAFLSGIVAISAGYVKVYQIQEKLEKAIKLQQEWMSFGSVLSSELQLPLHLRKDALYIIIKYKDIYNELIKQQVDISRRIMEIVAVRNGVEPHALSMSEMFERLLDTEATRVGIVIADAPPTPARRMVFSLHQHAQLGGGAGGVGGAGVGTFRLPPAPLQSPLPVSASSATHLQRQKISNLVLGAVQHLRRQSSVPTMSSVGPSDEESGVSDAESETREVDLDAGVVVPRSS